MRTEKPKPNCPGPQAQLSERDMPKITFVLLASLLVSVSYANSRPSCSRMIMDTVPFEKVSAQTLWQLTQGISLRAEERIGVGQRLLGSGKSVQVLWIQADTTERIREIVTAIEGEDLTRFESGPKKHLTFDQAKNETAKRRRLSIGMMAGMLLGDLAGVALIQQHSFELMLVGAIAGRYLMGVFAKNVAGEIDELETIAEEKFSAGLEAVVDDVDRRSVESRKPENASILILVLSKQVSADRSIGDMVRASGFKTIVLTPNKPTAEKDSKGHEAAPAGAE